MKEIKADTFTDHFSGRVDQLSVVCVCVCLFCTTTSEQNDLWGWRLSWWSWWPYLGQVHRSKFTVTRWKKFTGKTFLTTHTWCTLPGETEAVEYSSVNNCSQPTGSSGYRPTNQIATSG